MMFRKIAFAGGAVCMLAYADFSYEQTSRITGGAMQSMMRVADVFSKSAREPIRSTILVKGDRMATITGDERIDIIDLNAETFTEINLKKKTYSTLTFAEMQQAIEKAAAEARKQQGESSAEFNMKADVKHTGAARNISGMDTKQAIVTLTTEVVDKKENAKGQMTFVMDMWLAPNIPGYDEIRNFYTRLANKINWSPLSGMAGAMMAGQSKGINEMVKEMSKLDGVPVYQVMRVGGIGPDGQPGAEPGSAAQAAPAQQQPQAPAPTAGEVAGNAASGAALSRAGKLGGLAGGLGGGFGGFGRRKKQEQQQEQPQQQPQQQAAAASAAQQPAAAGSLIEMTSELSDFSSAPVDASRFDFPAGFKKVESDRYKR